MRWPGPMWPWQRAAMRPGRAGPAGSGQTGPTGRATGGGPLDAVVQTAMHGQVGIITLDDQRKRNAIGARMANGIIAALAQPAGSERARPS